MSFLMIWLSWKQKNIKLIASSTVENMDKNGGFQLDRGQKLLHFIKRGIQNCHYQKTEVQQDCSPSDSRQIQDVW